jgi:hypothetical protein
MDNPWCKSLIITGTAKQLLALMETADPAWNNTPRAVTYVQIQLDIDAGATRLYVGNADVTATNRGFELIAGQAGPNSMTVFGNPISLASIWLVTSAPESEIDVNVTVVQA